MSEEYLERDLKSIELLVGETPKDINERCLQLCKDYLDGIWSQTNAQNIKVERISGGLSNMVFRCAAQVSADGSTESTELALRLYGEKPFSDDSDVRLNRHNDAIISLVMSERGLGPKLFGSFPEGQILQFIKHRHFTIEEQRDPTFVSMLAQKLARLHSVVVPINRNTGWLWDTIDKNVKMGYKKFDIRKMIDEYNLSSFESNDLSEELRWLRHTIEVVDSPICFSHNDFRGNNIMVSKGFDMNSNPKERILFCDFESSGYGYRGADFGTLFAQWNRKDMAYRETLDFPDENIIKPFIDEYIRESIRIYGNQYLNDKRNTFEHILKEVKVFTLVSYIFMLTSCLAIEDYKQMGITKKDLMFGADTHFKNYIHLKNQFI